jgi:putative nucleotidyltransferase with HDIG domain
MAVVDARTLVRETSGLASLPEVAARVIGMAEDPRTTAAQFGTVIGRDPNLAGRLLKIANSSYYSRSGGIDTIARAVAVIGTRQVRDLTLGISAIRTFSGIPIGVVSMEDFWVHSLYCAMLSRTLATAVDPKLEETVFVAGLLHDVGRLVHLIGLPEESRQALWMATEGADDVTDDMAERAVLGFDHTDVGSELACQWRLPEVLRECIAFHHAPERASPANARAVAIVHVANSLAYLAETDSTDLTAAPTIAPKAARLAGFDERRLGELVEESRAEIGELRRLFGL